MTSSNLNSIAVIILAISCIFVAIINAHQTARLDDLDIMVMCLKPHSPVTEVVDFCKNAEQVWLNR